MHKQWSKLIKWDIEDIESETINQKTFTEKAFDDADVTVTMAWTKVKMIRAGSSEEETMMLSFDVKWTDCRMNGFYSLNVDSSRIPKERKAFTLLQNGLRWNVFNDATSGEVTVGLYLVFFRNSPPTTGLPISDFATFFDSKELSDVDVVCQDKIFPAHKVILAGRSEVFKTMLTGPYKEANENKIEIAAFEPSVVEHMLKFIYEDRMTEDIATWELFHAAKMYGLDKLARLCLENLRKNLSVDNCCRMLEAAFVYDLKELFQLAMEFAKKNREQVSKTDGWKMLKEKNDEKLLAKICLCLM